MTTKWFEYQPIKGTKERLVAEGYCDNCDGWPTRYDYENAGVSNSYQPCLICNSKGNTQ